jgi:hypothetical protein
MNLGRDIKISTEICDGVVNAAITYNGEIVSGIQSISMTLSAGNFGDQVSNLSIEMYEPRELYVSDDRLEFLQSFINEARRLGATIKMLSVLDGPDEEEDEEGVVNSTGEIEIGKIAMACAAVAGLATILASSRKKGTVQKPALTSKDKEKYEHSSKKTK